MCRLTFALLLAIQVVLLQLRPCFAAETERIQFNQDVLPILSDSCFPCHGPDERHREAELRLDLPDDVFDDRGDGRMIVPGDPAQSALFRRVISSDSSFRMPPHGQRQLSRREIDVLRRWIEQGAEWTGHWAFTPPKRRSLPAVPDAAENAIDTFVRSRLARERTSPAPPASKSTLARRAALDLTGLPLSPAARKRFHDDPAPDAYERLVDRLLASPRYGEHMAVRWLDAARYADTDGYQNDRIRYMWVWRDWLIDAINSGMPFDQFTIEQLAGDLLPDATLRQQIATGFCRNHRINSEGGSIPEEWAVEYVVDRVDTLGTVWLGLTLGCARCHDHKYDPVTQREYYGLYAYFNNVPEWGLGPNNGNSPPFITVPDSWPHVPAGENRLIPPAPYKLKTTQTSVVRPNPGGPKTVMVMAEMPDPRKTYLLKRGQYNQPDLNAVIAAGIPSVLRSEAGAKRSDKENRLSLARWLVGENNPLTARVVVNRHWQHIFGTGLVKTSENFGLQGQRPSHPLLLDWLAVEYVHGGWDTKALHRMIACSATYRQSSAASPERLRADPDNRLLARGPRVRLSAQAIRDQALLASGLLVEQLGGESVKPYMPPGIWKSVSNNKYKQDHGAKLYRRSVYTYWRRTLPPPTMLGFNAAEREVCTVRKPYTNSPLQALTLMNNILFVESSRMLAERVCRQTGDAATRIDTAFQLVLGRSPSPREAIVMRDAHNAYKEYFLSRQAAAEALLKIGEHPSDENLPHSDLAAMTMVASTLLNLDEAVNKP